MKDIQEILISDEVNKFIHKVISEWVQFTGILVITGLSMYLGSFYKNIYTTIFSLANYIILYVFIFFKLNKFLFQVLNKKIRSNLILFLSISLMSAIFYFIFTEIIFGLVIININFLEKVFNN